MGWEGRAARFRPLIFPVGRAKTTEIRLHSCCQIAETASRHQALDRLAAEMAADADHPDWDEVFGFFANASDLAPTTFDVLDRLIECPDAVALCALKISSGLFETMWSALEGLPFSWSVLPVSAWIRASRLHATSARVGLAASDFSEDEIARQIEFSLVNVLEVAPELRKSMANVADLVRLDVLGKSSKNSILELASSPVGVDHIGRLLEEERTELLIATTKI